MSGKISVENLGEHNFNEMEPQRLIGKTVKAINNDSCNCLNIEFTDGTYVCIEGFIDGHGLVNIVPFRVEESDNA